MGLVEFSAKFVLETLPSDFQLFKAEISPKNIELAVYSSEEDFCLSKIFKVVVARRILVNRHRHSKRFENSQMEHRF